MPVRLNKLRKYRKDSRVKQSTLAYHLGVTTQFYSQLERGVNKMSLETAFILARYFHTTVDDLFREDFTRKN